MLHLRTRRDAVLVLLAAAHGAFLLLSPSMWTVGLGLWWSSNTISHNALHRSLFRPLFRRRSLDRLFSLYLTVLLGVPQTLWRERHLAHHRGEAWRLRFTAGLALEVLLVLALWGALLALVPAFFLREYLPGYAGGLLLCAVHGHYEHAGGVTTSHHGRLYNFLFLNDGYHVEHHRRPGLHWSLLPRQVRRGDPASFWPAPLRWLEAVPGLLERLERFALASGALQRFLLSAHEGAFRALLPRVGRVERAAIVGGGLFPRTALILRRLLPAARLVVIDSSEENIRRARALLGEDVEWVHSPYDPSRHAGYDLLVVPLSFRGDRRGFYRSVAGRSGPEGPAVMVHDWIWRRRGEGAVVSLFLLKRLNLVLR